MTHKEESEVDVWRGNMQVLERSPERGYKLRCACGTEFRYVPHYDNAVYLSPGGTRAMCPKCKTVWDSKTEPRKDRPLRYFSIAFQLAAPESSPIDLSGKSGEIVEVVDFTFTGVGVGYSPREFALNVLSDPDYRRFEWYGLQIIEITEAKFKEVRERIAAHNRKHIHGYFNKLFGPLLEDDLGGESQGEDDPEEREAGGD